MSLKVDRVREFLKVKVSTRTKEVVIRIDTGYHSCIGIIEKNSLGEGQEGREAEAESHALRKRFQAVMMTTTSRFVR